MNPTITYVTTCKGRLHQLEKTLPSITAQPSVTIVVCDYGCPDGTGDWILARFPQVKVVRGTDAGFNLARARNLGATVAETEWLGFFDADIMIAPDFFARVVPELASGHYYLADPSNPGTSGSCLVEASAFRAAGGYDEAIDGWGGEDLDLYEALSLLGIRQASYPANLITPLPHSDDERTRFYVNKSLDRSARLSQIYRFVKGDLVRLTSRALDLSERMQLRRLVANMVEHAAAGTEAEPLLVPAPERAIRTRPPGPKASRPRLRCWLNYEVIGYGKEQDAPPDTGASDNRVTDSPDEPT
jgi:glycosyltransferase involved in cell wall biosynthesis